MTKNELTKAFEIASSNEDLSLIDDSNLCGFGLKSFTPVHTTLKAVAKIIRWQALRLNGTWDAEALQEVCFFAKSKFLIIG